MKNVIITLRIYRGRVSYDENQKVTSENQLMKLHYGILEWTNFIKSVRHLGYSKIDVVKCVQLDLKGGEHKEIDVKDIIREEIKVALHGEKVELTTEQKEIQELKEAIAELKGSKPSKKEKAAKVDNTPNDNDELELARAKFEEVFGKKPNHLMKLSTLNQKIEENQGE